MGLKDARQLVQTRTNGLVEASSDLWERGLRQAFRHKARLNVAREWNDGDMGDNPLLTIRVQPQQGRIV
jgi:hypothetical protein